MPSRAEVVRLSPGIKMNSEAAWRLRHSVHNHLGKTYCVSARGLLRASENWKIPVCRALWAPAPALPFSIQLQSPWRRSEPPSVAKGTAAVSRGSGPRATRGGRRCAGEGRGEACGRPRGRPCAPPLPLSRVCARRNTGARASAESLSSLQPPVKSSLVNTDGASPRALSAGRE